jgi:hypothetical protein
MRTFLTNLLYPKPRHPLCLYTALFGDRDATVDERWGQFGIPVVCFTDRPEIHVPGVEFVRVPRQYSDPTRCARYYKICAHHVLPQFEVSMWFDADMVPGGESPVEAVHRYLAKDDVAIFQHPERSCLYEEARVCVELERDDPGVIAAQIVRYRREGIPVNQGLYASGVLLRRHGARRVRAFSKLWWKEVSKGSRRDQISLPAVIYRLRMPVRTIQENIFRNALVEVIPHSGKEQQSWKISVESLR